MTTLKSPTIHHVLAHAKRDLERLERRFANGAFEGEPSRMRWAIACQQRVVAEIERAAQQAQAT